MGAAGWCRLAPVADVSTLAKVGAVFYVGLVLVVLAGLCWGVARRDVMLLRLIVVGVGVFQVAHFSEHTQQMVGLIGRPGVVAMTPWADGLAAGLASFVGREHEVGMEFLHLAGDSIYMAGLLALLMVHHLARRDRPLSRWAAGFQGVHLVEHVFLVTTVLAYGRPLGMSTLFGHAGVNFRVTWHFVMNAAGSACWLADAVPWVRVRHERRMMRWAV